MSTASDRKAARESLAQYSLMTPEEIAGVLRVSTETVITKLKAGHMPWVSCGAGAQVPRYGVDPIDFAVYVLAEKEGPCHDARGLVIGRYGTDRIPPSRYSLESPTPPTRGVVFAETTTTVQPPESRPKPARSVAQIDRGAHP